MANLQTIVNTGILSDFQAVRPSIEATLQQIALQAVALCNGAGAYAADTYAASITTYDGVEVGLAVVTDRNVASPTYGVSKVIISMGILPDQIMVYEAYIQQATVEYQLLANPSTLPHIYLNFLEAINALEAAIAPPATVFPGTVTTVAYVAPAAKINYEFTVSSVAVAVGSSYQTTISPAPTYAPNYASSAPSSIPVDKNGLISPEAPTVGYVTAGPFPDGVKEFINLFIDSTPQNQPYVITAGPGVLLAVGDQWRVPVFPSLPMATSAWTTSNAAVATVDENGLVTGVSVGTATISIYGASVDIIVEVNVAKDVTNTNLPGYNLPV